MAKTKRVRAKIPTRELANLKAVDTELRLFAEAQKNVALLETEAALKIAKIKENLAKDCVSPKKAMKIAEKSIEFYGLNNPEVYQNKKSRALPNGTFGTRASTSWKIDHDSTKGKTLDLIKKHLTKKQREMLIREGKEGVIKDMLDKLPKADRRKINIHENIKDVFFLDPEKTEAADLG